MFYTASTKEYDCIVTCKISRSASRIANVYMYMYVSHSQVKLYLATL